MEELLTILQPIGSIASPLVTIWLLWKVGLLGGKNKTEKKPTNGEKVITHRNSEDIKTLFNHAEIANQEMGTIKITLEGIQKDIHYIIKNLDKK